MAESPQGVEQTLDGENQAESAASALGEAAAAMLRALLVFLLFTLTILARAFQAFFLIAPALARAACVGVVVFGAVSLFQWLTQVYGNDLAAVVLALATVLMVPASVLALAPGYLWGALLLAGLVELLARAALPHAPSIVLAALPGIALAAAVLQLAFGGSVPKGDGDGQVQFEWERAAVDHHDRPPHFHSGEVGRPDSEHPAGSE